MNNYNLDKKSKLTTILDFINDTPLGYIITLLCTVVGTLLITVLFMRITTPDIVHMEKPVRPPIVIEQPQQPDHITSEEVKDQVHAALGRGLRIDQSCYDPGTDLWLVHARELPEEDADSEGVWEEGWYYQDTDDIAVLKLGNGSMSITNPGAIFNTKIDPDITGLECKQHKKD